MDIYYLLSNQSVRKVLFTCLANTKNIYVYTSGVPSDQRTLHQVSLDPATGYN